MFLLDTNVVSDAAKKTNHLLNSFLASQTKESLFISTISLAEISYGIYRLPKGRKKDALTADLLRMEELFEGQILDLTAKIALEYGRIQAMQVSQGFNDNPFDNLIIATAIVNNLTVLTRNHKDFINRGVKVFYPK